MSSETLKTETCSNIHFENENLIIKFLNFYSHSYEAVLARFVIKMSLTNTRSDIDT